MRHRIGGFLLAALVASPALAGAQGTMPKHEFGVDALIDYFKADYTGADSHIDIGTPVDVRIGFLRESQLQWTAHFTFNFDSKGGLKNGNSTSAYLITPALNAEWKMRPGTGLYHQMGPFITGGAGVLLGSDGQSFHQFSINAGLGTRKAWGSGAVLLAGFFQYGFESGSQTDPSWVPSFTQIGARVGISLFH